MYLCTRKSIPRPVRSLSSTTKSWNVLNFMRDIEAIVLAIAAYRLTVRGPNLSRPDLQSHGNGVENVAYR